MELNSYAHINISFFYTLHITLAGKWTAYRAELSDSKAIKN